jgi:hypothetical protein
MSRSDRPDGCRSNPVGLGFAASGSNKNFTGLPVPNMLPVDASFQRPTSSAPVVGFSWIAPNWEPRVDLAGTYDDAWLKNRMPNLPDDFQDRFFNAAPVDQQLKNPIQGGEVVQVENATPKGRLEFTVPKETLRLSVCLGDDLLEQEMRCDTAIVHAEKQWLSLVWRATVDVHQRVPEFSWSCVERGGETV